LSVPVRTETCTRRRQCQQARPACEGLVFTKRQVARMVSGIDESWFISRPKGGPDAGLKHSGLRPKT